MLAVTVASLRELTFAEAQAIYEQLATQGKRRSASGSASMRRDAWIDRM